MPSEPPLVWQIDTAESGYDPKKTYTELLAFHLYGKRGGGESGRTRLPALLHRYRDLTRIRFDYPVCVAHNGSAGARPLMDCVDELLSAIADDSDDGRRLRTHVYRVEAAIKALAGNGGGTLSQLWDKAAANVLAATPKDKRDLVRANLSVAKGALKADGALLECTEGAPGQMMSAVYAAFWEERCAPWRAELTSLIGGIRDILAADFNRSADASSADHLRETVGTDAGDDMDFEAMSAILGESHLGDPLPSGRRIRVEKVLTTLQLVEPVFAPRSKTSDWPFDASPVKNDCAVARVQHEKRAAVMTEFFKSVRIARLEIENTYREDVHDAFFQTFETSYLSPEELALCPPVVLEFDAAHLSAHGPGQLLALLADAVPVVALVSFGTLFEEGGSLSATARLASIALGMNHVYVQQTPASLPAVMMQRFAKGFAHAGPSLHCVYTGDSDGASNLPAYLMSAAALESRVFPTFAFDPSAGETLAERFDLSGNPQAESVWPGDSFAYRGADDAKTEMALSFTPAEFMSMEPGLSRLYWDVPPESWHEKMVRFDEFVAAPEEGTIPYIVTVDEDGTVGRSVVSRELLQVTDRLRVFWRNLQENGGIDNSFARNRIAAERERLEEEKQREVEAIEAKYAADLERDIGALTQEIVQRIAAQLMADPGGASVSFVAPAPVSETKTAPPAAEEEAAPAAEVEDEEEVAFDDPYIDTPLCTSCNECTKLNGRLFAYDGNKQAFIQDATAGTYRDLVVAAEKCPVHIIHPGKPKNPDESGLDELVERAARFN